MVALKEERDTEFSDLVSNHNQSLTQNEEFSDGVVELEGQHDQDCAEKAHLLRQVDVLGNVDSKKEKLIDKITNTLIEDGRILKIIGRSRGPVCEREASEGLLLRFSCGPADMIVQLSQTNVDRRQVSLCSMRDGQYIR